MLEGFLLAALNAGEWIALAGVVVGALAAAGVIATLLLLQQQTKAARNATLALVYQHISQQMIDIDRFFVEHADLRQYVYQDAPIDDGAQDWPRLVAFAELFVDFMDNVLVQSPALEYEAVAEDWKRYILDVYEHSPLVRRYWAEHGHRWYANSPLVHVFRQARIDDAVFGSAHETLPTENGDAGESS